MADDKASCRVQDRSKINLSDDGEARYWTEALGLRVGQCFVQHLLAQFMLVPNGPIFGITQLVTIVLIIVLHFIHHNELGCQGGISLMHPSDMSVSRLRWGREAIIKKAPAFNRRFLNKGEVEFTAKRNASSQTPAPDGHSWVRQPGQTTGYVKCKTAGLPGTLIHTAGSSRKSGSNQR